MLYSELCYYLNDYDNIYFYGGFVRDYILGLHSKDIDLVADNKTLKELMNKISCHNDVRRVEKSRGIYSYKIDDGYIQFFTLRGGCVNIHGIYYTDFTMNSLFMNKHGKIFDPTGFGEFDLKCGVIRCIDPEHSITQDPIRILRAIRFAVQYDFVIDNKLADVMKNYLYMLTTSKAYEFIIHIYISIMKQYNKVKTIEWLRKFNLGRFIYETI
jgi:tRNA nucleotidyltransferase/poly(A) polymerase